MLDIAIVAVVMALVAISKDRIAGWPLTGPMIFVGIGMVLGPHASGALSLDLERETVTLTAEITLALLLFSDAARIDTNALRQSLSLPARLLGIGLPLTIVVGTLITGTFLTDLSWSEAALVAAILAPTDAALGQAVVTNMAVPVRIRQALNVESGLNDGLVVPVVALFASLVFGGEIESAGSLIAHASFEVLIGATLGAGLGGFVGRVMTIAVSRRWSDDEGLRLTTLGGALASYSVVELAGGNGFIAAFACGIVLHLVLGDQASRRASLAEDLGQVGASATLILFGAVMVWPALAEMSWRVVGCALATLVIGRMVPVKIAMLGAGLKEPTVLFLGWFGPRGLASMLFGLLLLEKHGESADPFFLVITIVILASVVLHGMTAAPGARLYSRWYAAQGHPTMAESEHVAESRVRWTRR